jgi:Zn-dependent protease
MGQPADQASTPEPRKTTVSSSIDVWGQGILFLIALILSVSVHEFGHAWAATKLGDSLPRAQGRLTLNPIRHIDPIGTLLFPILMLVFKVPLLGWGRPVETNPLNYTRRFSRSTGHMLVAIAGPGMNMVMALVISVLVVVGARAGYMNPEFGGMLVTHLVVLNLSLLFFNLLPIPPLDGGAVLAWVLPRSMQGAIEFLNRWGFIILLGLVMTPLLHYLMVPASYLTGLWLDLLRGAIQR